MPQGSKAKYTAKQKRQASHIEKQYEKKGDTPKRAAGRAWAIVNKQTGGGKKPGGSGAKKSAASEKASRARSGKRAAAGRSAASRSASARKAAATRKQRST